MTINNDKQLAIYFASDKESTQLQEGDIYALLLKDDMLMNVEDFVYYGSKNRSRPFNPVVYGSVHKWELLTCPMSLDGSVFLEMDYKGDEFYDSRYSKDDSQEYEVLSERCIIHLQQVSPEYNIIIVGYALYGSDTVFGEAKEVIAEVFDEQCHEPIARMKTRIPNNSHSAVEGIILKRDDNNSWYMTNGTKSFPNGLKGVANHFYH